MTKNLFNPQFGSIFRTCHNPTYFSRRLCRFSDIYMASLSCLLNYDLSYTFYPRRTPLQHEAPLWMDQLCTGCRKTPFLEEMSHIRWELYSLWWLLGFHIRPGEYLRLPEDFCHIAVFIFSQEGAAQLSPQDEAFLFYTVTHFPNEFARGCCRFSCCPGSVWFS